MYKSRYGILGSTAKDEEESSLSLYNSSRSNGFLGVGTVESVNAASGNYTIVIHRTGALEICTLASTGVLHSPSEGELVMVFQDVGESYIIPLIATNGDGFKFAQENIPSGYTALFSSGKGGVFVSGDGSVIVKAGNISEDFISEEGKYSLVTRDYIINTSAGRIGMQSTDDASEMVVQVKHSPKSSDHDFVYEDRIGSVDVSKHNLQQASSGDMSVFEQNKSDERLHYYSIPQDSSVIRLVTYTNPKISSDSGNSMFPMFSGNDFSRVHKYTMDGSIETVEKYQYGVTGDVEHDVPAQSYLKKKELINGSMYSESKYNSYFGSEEVVLRERVFVDQKVDSIESEIDLPGDSESDRNTRILFDWNAKKIDNYILKESNFSGKARSPLHESTSLSEGGRRKYSRSRIYFADDGLFVNISIQMLFGINDILPPQLQSEVSAGDAIYSAKVKWMVSGEDIDQSVGLKSGFLELKWGGENNNYLYEARGSAFMQLLRSSGNNVPVFISRELVKVNNKDAYGVSGGIGTSLGLPVAPDKREKIENEFIDVLRPDLRRIKNIRFEDQINDTVKFTQYISQIKHSGTNFSGERVYGIDLKSPSQVLGWYSGPGYRGQGYYPEKVHFSDIDLDNDFSMSRSATMIDPYSYANDLSRLADAIYVVGAYLSNMLRPAVGATDATLPPLPIGGNLSYDPNKQCLSGALTRSFFFSDYNVQAGFMIPAALGVNSKAGIDASNDIILRIGRIFESKKYDSWVTGGAKCPGGGISGDVTGMDKDTYDDATKDYNNAGFFGRAGGYLASTAIAGFSGKKPAFPGYKHMFNLMKKLRFNKINSKYSDTKINDVSYRIPDYSVGVGDLLDNLFEVE